MKTNDPKWLDIEKWLKIGHRAEAGDVVAALSAQAPGSLEFAVLSSPAAGRFLEPLAQRAQALTRARFGRTMSLYVPLYLSNHCSGGCLYCGFASDRKQLRRKLEVAELKAEMAALKQKGFEDVLLLTGERTPAADYDYLLNSVKAAAEVFHNVTIEAFAMTSAEYEGLVKAGCTGVTIYQETYDRTLYAELHRWGEKRDYEFRLDAPARALEAGMRYVGLGALLGLSEPRAEVLSLFHHALFLRKEYWKAGMMVSFPRLCAQYGDFKPRHEVDDKLLAQLIFAFRICCPDMPLVLSTRERADFRDGIAGLGISRMSAASKTTVGGYHEEAGEVGKGQFDVNDTRDVETFCRAMRARGLEPVFKNWESLFR